MKKILIPAAATLCIAIIAGAFLFIKKEKPAKPFTSPLYLTIVIHNEEDTSKCALPKPQIPDYDGNETVLQHFTMAMREFGEMAASHGAKINFGTDWTFSEGVELYDPTFYADMETMGHEIDAHAHESCILYEEVKEGIVDAGGTPTQVASGMSEGEIYDQMNYFDNFGDTFKVLWGVALAGHGAGEEMSSWVWRPSRTNWLEHDPEGEYIHIGHGEFVNNIDTIKEAAENRLPNVINTYAVFTKPREYLAAPATEGIPEEWTAKPESGDYWENRIEWWDAFLAEIDALENVEYASLTEIADIFIANEDRLEFNFDAESHPRSEIPGPQRQSQAGYP